MNEFNCKQEFLTQIIKHQDIRVLSSNQNTRPTMNNFSVKIL